MDRIWQDIRYGLRQLRMNPGHTSVAVVSLVLGIAANTTIFGVINGLLLKPLPGRNPEELVTVYTSDYSGPLYGASSYPDYVDFGNGQDVFAGLAAYTMEPMLLTPPHAAESLRVTGQLVSANYFDVLGVTAAAGRTFIPADDSNPAQHVVLNHTLCVRLFGGDAGIIGREVQLNGRYFTVVGVAPPDFEGIMRGLQVAATGT
jgi:hypothetical protein